MKRNRIMRTVDIVTNILFVICLIILKEVENKIIKILTIGLVFIIMIFRYTINLKIWKCSNCGNNLPSSNKLFFFATKKCPYCGLDINKSDI